MSHTMACLIGTILQPLYCGHCFSVSGNEEIVYNLANADIPISHIKGLSNMDTFITSVLRMTF